MRWLLVPALILLGGCTTLKEGDAFQREQKLVKAGFRGVESARPEGLEPDTFQASEDGSTWRYYLAESGLLFTGDAEAYKAYRWQKTKDRARRADNLSRLGGRRPLGPLQW